MLFVDNYKYSWVATQKYSGIFVGCSPTWHKQKKRGFGEPQGQVFYKQKLLVNKGV